MENKYYVTTCKGEADSLKFMSNQRYQKYNDERHEGKLKFVFVNDENFQKIRQAMLEIKNKYSK